ncbi:hypothetical protein LWI29_020050 [Acer saccharum]|uniref:Uncharacterized protein n=1 Tax=Acer saccharum TaxID=4024 RepID=A0AA39RXH3_ACESA|nr:hypothetical protein LWI29_020050 [Acer saccharum]
MGSSPVSIADPMFIEADIFDAAVSSSSSLHVAMAQPGSPLHLQVGTIPASSKALIGPVLSQPLDRVPVSVGVSVHGSVQSSGLLVQGNKCYADLLKTSHSLPRGKAIVGEVDPLVGSSLPLSSIRGFSYANRFMVAPIQEDNVSSPSILSKKVCQSQQVGRSEDSLIGVPIYSSRMGAGPVYSEGPSSILDVSAGSVVSISSIVSMVGQRAKVKGW